MFKFNDIEDAVADIRAGKIIIVMDDEDRENEGDLVMAAENHWRSNKFYGHLWKRTYMHTYGGRNIQGITDKFNGRKQYR